MSSTFAQVETSASEDQISYQALSSAAVTTLVVGFLSALALLDWIGVAIPVVGVVLGVYAWRKIRSRPDELTGLGLAKLGLALCVFFFVIGLSRLSYVYATEVPEGYTRISYEGLQPDPDVLGQQIPPEVLALNGQKVFIKGFPLSGRQKDNIVEFVLVRDRGDCCYGGNPKITDQIVVKLADNLRFNYDLRMLKLAGTFHVRPPGTPGAVPGVFYHLDADHLQ